MRAEQIPVEVAKGELALRQKLVVQFEVMKVLNFLPAYFDTKAPDASLADGTIWSMWSDGGRGASNAEIFSDEYDDVLHDPVQRARLETEPHEIIKKIAAKLRDKNSFLN